jgi:hypothetical protein
MINLFFFLVSDSKVYYNHKQQPTDYIIKLVLFNLVSVHRNEIEIKKMKKKILDERTFFILFCFSIKTFKILHKKRDSLGSCKAIWRKMVCNQEK